MTFRANHTKVFGPWHSTRPEKLGKQSSSCHWASARLMSILKEISHLSELSILHMHSAESSHICSPLIVLRNPFSIRDPSSSVFEESLARFLPRTLFITSIISSSIAQSSSHGAITFQRQKSPSKEARRASCWTSGDPPPLCSRDMFARYPPKTERAQSCRAYQDSSRMERH